MGKQAGALKQLFDTKVTLIHLRHFTDPGAERGDCTAAEGEEHLNAFGGKTLLDGAHFRPRRHCAAAYDDHCREIPSRDTGCCREHSRLGTRRGKNAYHYLARKADHSVD